MSHTVHFVLWWTLAYSGTSYDHLECQSESFIHYFCAQENPGPLEAPELFDLCLRHERHCHLGI